MRQIGERVIAIRNGDSEKKEIYSYGEGTYIGRLKQPVGTQTPFGPVEEDWPQNLTNPCILLDSGHVVWGNQCWWGSVDQMNTRYEGFTFIDVDPPDNPRPEGLPDA